MRTLLLLFLLFTLPAAAADIEYHSKTRILSVYGELELGDEIRFDRLASRANLVLLHSPGGNVLAGLKMGFTIAKHRLDVAVARDRMCASACMLLFAASPRRFVYSTSRIGVHSASLRNAEAPGATLLSARLYEKLGVPYQIIGKMVSTDPDRITWLSRADLSAWGVLQID